VHVTKLREVGSTPAQGPGPERSQWRTISGGSVVRLRVGLARGRGLFTAAITVLSQRRAFRRSTSIARRWGHMSIWATRSALVFALRLLRLGQALIAGHKTSVSIEDAFWKGLKEIARDRDMTQSELRHHNQLRAEAK
jgi:hypothetical protein